MPSPISIIVQSTGVRLDVLPDTTVEVNMGGISLLSLEQRTATYTNTFKLPRTPTNEQAFGFASSPTRSNRPSMSVNVQKGLFQHSAMLTVSTFEDSYNCTLKWDESSVIDSLNSQNFCTLPEYGTIYSGSGILSYEDAATRLCAIRDDGLLFILLGYGRLAEGGVAFMTTSSFMHRLNDLFGITFSGSILLNADFLNFAFANHWYRLYATYETSPTDWTYIHQEIKADTSAYEIVSCSTILKVLCQIFGLDISISGLNIELIKMTEIMDGTPVSVDTLTSTKDIINITFLNGVVRYNVVDKTAGENLSSDTITSVGVGTTELLKINSFVPPHYTGTYSGYDFLDTSCYGKIIGMKLVNGTYTVNVGYDVSINANMGHILTMSGFYSATLNPIFASPVVLNASGWLDPITANNLMTSRLLLSRQLQGLYWVETMAYDLTSGRVKMKLIKLPQ